MNFVSGVDVSNVLLPSYNILFNYGPRSLYLNMPKNRNEIFDISFSGIVTTLGLSMVGISNDENNELQHFMYDKLCIELFSGGSFYGVEIYCRCNSGGCEWVGVSWLIFASSLFFNFFFLMADHLGDDKHLPHCAHRHAESEQHNGAVAIE